MMRRIYRFEHEGRPVLGFDTGLDARAFAQAKLAQLITEGGIVIFPDGAAAPWTVSGVVEAGGPPQAGGEGASMVVWGPDFEGERLDLIINDNTRRDEALTAAARWIGAVLRNKAAPSLPCAALIAADGTALFTPPNLALRCALVEGETGRLGGKEWYAHPDFSGENAAAFTAAAMLYRIFAGAPPFPAGEENLLHQDMREGNFLPIRLAAPGLDTRLADLIQKALGPPDKTASGSGGGDPKGALAILRELSEILMSPGGNIRRSDSFFHDLSADKRLTLENEKARFLKRKSIETRTRRFVIRNTAIIAGCAVALLAAILVVRSIVKSRAELPTTRGMNSEEVVQTYYGAFGELDHTLMEACVIKGAGKSDIDMVLNLFVINKVRQAYEAGRVLPLIPASEWKESGAGPVDSQVFGVTDLEIERLSAGEGEEASLNEIRYRAAYTLWFPFQPSNDAERENESFETPEANPPPQAAHYTDELTLIRDKGNWRISAIDRGSQNLGD